MFLNSGTLMLIYALEENGITMAGNNISVNHKICVKHEEDYDLETNELII